MCQLNLTTAKTSIRSARCFIQCRNPMRHLPRNTLKKNQPSPIANTNSMVSILISRKIMTEITNPHQMPTASNDIVTNSYLRKIMTEITNPHQMHHPCNIMQLWQIAWVYHPMLSTTFMYTYMLLPMLCAKTLTTLLLPCFHAENV